MLFHRLLQASRSGAVVRTAATRQFHSRAPAFVKAFPEVETEKKITYSPTTVGEREQIRKMEKNSHADMDQNRPPRSDASKNEYGQEPPLKDVSAKERTTKFANDAADNLLQRESTPRPR